MNAVTIPKENTGVQPVNSLAWLVLQHLFPTTHRRDRIFQDRPVDLSLFHGGEACALFEF
jgi:hypothetical protein